MMLSIENLDVSYRREDGEVTAAARDVNLSLARGEILGLVGESGSGKSTVALSIPRLLPSPPAFYPKGRILWEGEDILKMPLARLRDLRGRRISVVFQDPMGSLSPLHRIGDQLIETIRLHQDISRVAAKEIALGWLERVRGETSLDAASWAKAYPHELSGGLQQRVMIAMALMLEPDLVIADEPTTALDVSVQAQVLRLLRSLTGNRRAVLLITHDLGVVSQLATRIAVMQEGRVVEMSDDPAAFFANPQHTYSRTLIREAKKMEIE